MWSESDAGIIEKLGVCVGLTVSFREKYWHHNRINWKAGRFTGQMAGLLIYFKLKSNDEPLLSISPLFLWLTNL